MPAFLGARAVLGRARRPAPANATPYPADVLSIASLVGYYRMADPPSAIALTDLGPNALPATIVGNPTFGAIGMLVGDPSPAITFNGAYASLGAAGEALFHNWDYTQPFTMEAIIRPNAARATQYTIDTIFAKFDGGVGSAGLRFGLIYRSGKLVLDLLRQNTQSGNKFMDAFGTTDLANGQIWHVKVSSDATGTVGGVKMWVNGLPETVNNGADTLAGSTTINSVSPSIGAYSTGGSPFHGDLQELAIYNTAVGAQTAAMQFSNVLSSAKPFLHHSYRIGRTPPANLAAPNLILLSDLASDIDDAGDIALCCALHLRGEINLVGVIIDSANDRGADAAYAFVKYMLGATTASALIGAWQGAVPAGTPSNSFYTADISATFGANVSRTAYPDGVQKLRAILGAAANSSVVLVETGFFTVLDGVLTSPANAGGDGLPSGVALITTKARRLVVSAGLFPTGAGDFNVVNGPSAAASDVAANWPGEVVWQGDNMGLSITAGPPSTAASSTNPVQQAFHDWVANGGSFPRSTWGQMGVLFAARGFGAGFEPAGLSGTYTINSGTGAESFSYSLGNHSFIRQTAADGVFQTLFNSMYAALPGAFTTATTSPGGGSGNTADLSDPNNAYLVALAA